jgi:hypothetical protein
MAQPSQLDAGFALHGPAQHHHRVGVVQHCRSRAVALHVVGDLQHHRDGAQRSEDARRPARVADVGVDTILLGDLQVVPPDIHAAGQDSHQYHVGIFQGLGAIQRGLDFGGVLAHIHDPLHRLLGELQPLGIDIHQR